MAQTARRSWQHYVGRHAHEVYRALILGTDGATHFHLCRYRSPPSLQDRLEGNGRAQEVVQQAMERRKDGVTPFWQAIFSVCLANGWCSRELVRAALFHAGPGEVTSHSVAVLEDREISAMLGEDEANVALASHVLLKDGTCVHLAMLDFRCDVSEGNTHLVQNICRELYQHGFVLIDSGDSYHACGVTTLSAEQRVAFLGRALLLAPIIDAAYLGHQLQQEFSTIRVSVGGALKRMPTVIAAVR